MRFTCKQLYNFIFLLCGLWFLSSCYSVKNYPVNKPFVYENKINLIGNLPKDDKKKLSTELQNYWDDSIKARWQQRFLISKRLNKPSVIDTTRIPITLTLMESYLRSQGYYHAELRDTVIYTSKKEKSDTQIRATIVVNIHTGKPTVIDSFAFEFADSTLQKLALNNAGKAFIKPGSSVFTTAVVGSELDRNLSIFRQNGYYRLNKEDIIAHVDTIDQRLLQIITDPFEQVKVLDEVANKRKEKPTASVVFKLRSQVDSSYYQPTHTRQYFIDSVFYYPEYNGIELPDSFIRYKFSRIDTAQGFIIKKDDYNMFRMHPMREQTYLRKKQLYNETRYIRTLNSLGQLGAWNQVDAVAIPSGGDSLNFHILLAPQPRYNFTANLEASRNTGDFLGSTDLFGIALNTTIRDRNFQKKAFQQSLNLRNGVELSFAKNTQLLQTIQSSINYTLTLPRLRWTPVVDTVLNRIYRNGILGLRILKVPQQQWSRENAKTVINLGGSYTDRQQFFRLRSVTGSGGFEWRRGDNSWLIRFPNIEFYSLDTLAGLREAFKTNPFLRSAFNTGTIVGGIINWTKVYRGRDRIENRKFARVGLEFSGAPYSQKLSPLLYQYIKAEVEYVLTMNFSKVSMNKDELAWRIFGGVGINYSDVSGVGFTLPFYKQFIAGGPNSMRAWGLRQLGLGSSLQSDTSSSFTDRFGDMQIETNLEYRKKLFNIGTAVVNGAVFTDIGNIWNIRRTAANDSSVFNVQRLWQDLAIGTGVGLRLDFSYFLIRIDFAVKIKDPARRENNGWLLPNFTWQSQEFADRPVKNNWALQLGVGLPF